MSKQPPAIPEEDLEVTRPGPLAWFAGNRVAANLLMLFILIAGALALSRMKVELFQEIDPGMIKVSVPYPGASPSEVEKSICIRVEEAIEGIEGIKRLSSVAAEGMGTVVAELEDDADGAEALDDVKQAVDRILDFPPREAEEAKIVRVDTDNQVVSVVLMAGQDLSGLSELELRDVMRALKETAEDIRDELTAKPNISQVTIAGTRPYEISIELSEEAMQRYGLSFEQVAGAVRQGSLDLPGGSIKTEGGEILLRTKGQRYIGQEFGEIVVLNRGDGTVVQLRGIATVVDGFEDTDVLTKFDRRPAVLLNVKRVGDQDALDVAATVRAYIEGKEVPAGMSLATWNDRSRYLNDRLNLLIRNALIGLTLVFLCLTLFLDLRLAFWTTMGIPISFMGGFLLMPIFGVSINMISLFALIVVLGIVVDDAIVVGENVFSYRQRGMKGLDAAIKGCREMAVPVTLAILTSVAAFLPLYYTEGQLGKILWPISIVVVAVLMVSLVEALLILPAHLSTARRRQKEGLIARGQAKVRRGLEWLVHHVYANHLAWAVRNRYLTIAIAVAMLMVTVGFIGGGLIEFRFMPKVEADNIWATLEMPQGARVEDTEAVVRHMEAMAEKLREELDAQRPAGAPSILRHMSTTIGQQPFASQMGGGPAGGAVVVDGGSHLAEINIELLSSEQREISGSRIAQRWRELVGDVPGVASLTFNNEIFNAGDAISVQLMHEDYGTLQDISAELQRRLRTFAGVTDISDTFEPGKRELQLDLKPAGRAAGLRLEDLARQVRRGFYGEEVQRIQRGRDDIKVMVRYPEQSRRSLSDIHNMRIRVPQQDGSLVELPFDTVATVSEGRGYATIDRVDRRRAITVTADVNEAVANATNINDALRSKVLPELASEYPGLLFSFEGEDRELRESLLSLRSNMLIALLAIFGLLAVQFRSYVQPVIVMCVIPFGMVGAVIGHLVMGYDLSMLSGFGVVALTGVVVNDSLIMIDLINRERARGNPMLDAVMQSGVRRFRPILLTTLTTFFGLMPMILERSLQARFLIPMALSLGFGVLFATAITLILVPAVYLVVEDLARFFRWVFGRKDRDLKLVKAA